MFVSVMTNNCSLEHWRSNSRVDHVISDQGPGGDRVVPEINKTNEYKMNIALYSHRGVICTTRKLIIGHRPSNRSENKSKKYELYQAPT